MRPNFARSHETDKLTALFRNMSAGQTLSFADATKRCGFVVSSTLSAYHSARRIVTRDDQIVIEGIRSVGFTRLIGTDIVKRGDKHLRSIRRRSRVGGSEMNAAIAQNLPRDQMMLATEKFARFRYLEAGAAPVKATSNRQIVPEPPRA